MSQLSSTLYKLRTQSNLKQTAIAYKLGIEDTAWSNYERGIRQPDLIMLKKIAEFFNVSTDFLLGLTTIAYNPSDKLTSDLLELFTSCNPTEKKEVLNFIRTMKGDNK